MGHDVKTHQKHYGQWTTDEDTKESVLRAVGDLAGTPANQAVQPMRSIKQKTMGLVAQGRLFPVSPGVRPSWDGLLPEQLVMQGQDVVTAEMADQAPPTAMKVFAAVLLALAAHFPSLFSRKG